MKELPTRKSIRLKKYDYSGAGAYFVTICVKDRHKLLGEVVVGDDSHIVPPKVSHSEYGRIVDQFIKNITAAYKGVFVDKYIVMPNHIHIILVLENKKNESNATAGESGTMWASSPTMAIPTIVRSLKILVAKKCGFSFWQRSYHDHIIRNEEEYLRIAQYIDENPARWQDDCYYTK